MGARAVFLIGDSNFFHRTDGRKSVHRELYAMVKNIPVLQTAVYGMRIKCLSQTPQKIEELLQFLQSLVACEVMLVLCVGQHDVLEGKVREAISAVPRLTQLVEEYAATLVVIELYANGVEDINWAWKVRANAKVTCLGSHFMKDQHFISDKMHLTVDGQWIMACNLAATVRAWAQPHPGEPRDQSIRG